MERRGDAFVLEFQHSGDQVFAMATCDVTKGGSPTHFLEQVVDSSRYFVVKIQGGGGREALIVSTPIQISCLGYYNDSFLLRPDTLCP